MVEPKMITNNRIKQGFTLIELLIVVLIIAILAAIAVPNFLEFQTRAKVSRVKSDFRSLKTAIEAYTVDEGYEPWDFGPDEYSSWVMLTTPIAYMSTVLPSPFDDTYVADAGITVFPYWGFTNPDHDYALEDAREFNVGYAYTSVGPDGDHDLAGLSLLRPRPIALREDVFLNALYDPTNGTISSGDILMTSRKIENE